MTRTHWARWTLSVLIVVLVVAMAATTAVAKGSDLYTPLTIRIVGADGERSFTVVGEADGQDAFGFIEQVGGSLSVGSGEPAGLPAPGLTDFYEVVVTQGAKATNRVPWYGMPTAQFFYYPGRGPDPAYLRLHMARASEPVHDAWLIASPGLTNIVESHAHGLPTIRAQPGSTLQAPPSGWLAVVLLLMIGILLLLRLRTSRAHMTSQLKELQERGEGQARCCRPVAHQRPVVVDKRPAGDQILWIPLPPHAPLLGVDQSAKDQARYSSPPSTSDGKRGYSYLAGFNTRTRAPGLGEANPPAKRWSLPKSRSHIAIRPPDDQSNRLLGTATVGSFRISA